MTDPVFIAMRPGIEAEVCIEISKRQEFGIAKYGTTVADNPLSLRQWLQHAFEETLDKAIYLKRAIAEIDAQAVPYIGPDRRKTTCKDHLPVGDADADGWIKWEGGECPVPYGTRIDVEYRSGARAMDIRALVRKLTGHTATHWEHINGSSDIVAYRLSKEASHAEEVLRTIAEIDAQDVSYIGPDRRACGKDLDDMVRAGKSVLPEDFGACGNVGREAC